MFNYELLDIEFPKLTKTLFLQFVLSALVACASAIVPVSPYAAAYPAYGAAYHAPLAAPYASPYAYPAAVKTIAPAYAYGAYHAPLAAPIVKTAIAHPIATSYANTYKVAASYPAYHAPLAAYHAPIAGKFFSKCHTMMT